MNLPNNRLCSTGSHMPLSKHESYPIIGSLIRKIYSAFQWWNCTNSATTSKWIVILVSRLTICGTQSLEFIDPASYRVSLSQMTGQAHIINISIRHTGAVIPMLSIRNDEKMDKHSFLRMHPDLYTVGFDERENNIYAAGRKKIKWNMREAVIHKATVVLGTLAAVNWTRTIAAGNTRVARVHQVECVVQCIRFLRIRLSLCLYLVGACVYPYALASLQYVLFRWCNFRSNNVSVTKFLNCSVETQMMWLWMFCGFVEICLCDCCVVVVCKVHNIWGRKHTLRRTRRMSHKKIATTM